MPSLARLASLVRNLFRNQRAEDDLDQEVRSYVELLTQEKIRAGMSADEARRQARETRLEMEDWADGILATLESNLDKFLTAVRRGRERLHDRSQEDLAAIHVDEVSY